jgi:hypothetical protein
MEGVCLSRWRPRTPLPGTYVTSRENGPRRYGRCRHTAAFAQTSALYYRNKPTFAQILEKDRPMGGPNVVQCSGPWLNVLVTRPDIAAPICGHLFKLMQMICFGVLVRGQPQATAADLYQAIAPGVRRLY